MYSLSRAGYVAFLAGWLFIGVVKQKKLLVLLAVFGGIWASLVPNAVRMRVDMTYGETGELDHSSEMRVALWDDALQLVKDRPLIGTGFDTYRYMGRVGSYEDTHNFYLKVLVETGIVGAALFLWLLARTFRRGYLLSRKAQEPVIAGIGLGLAGWVIAAAVANIFGDRWTYLQVQGFLWVIAGLVARAWVLHEKAQPVSSIEINETAEARFSHVSAVPA
jgi:O-antigen ligase